MAVRVWRHAPAGVVVVLLTAVAVLSSVPPAAASGGAMEVSVGRATLLPGHEAVKVPVTLRCAPTSNSTGLFAAQVEVRQTTGPRTAHGVRHLFSTECDGTARTAVMWISSRPGVGFRPGLAVVSVWAYQINLDNTWLETRIAKRVPLSPSTAQHRR